MGVLKGAIELQDNMSAVLRNIRKEQSSFRADVQKTKRELQDTWDKKRTAKLDATGAAKAMDSLRKKLEPFRKKVVTAVAVKDAASEKIQSVTGKLKTLGKMAAAPVVKLKDMVSSGIASVGSKIKSLAKAVVVPVTIAATAGAAMLGGAVGSGMELETQQVSMSHFVQATNKGMGGAEVKQITDGYIAQLRDNANKTPFETGEVISAGSRAIAIAGGNTKDAMQMVKLSEDMAAASGGTKSISDAIEALADAKLGEMKRLKEFGFKVSKEQFDAKGFAGVSGDLESFYGGAAEKLASTSSGLLSTIKGKLKSNVADFGLNIAEKLKPAFEGIISIIDSAAPAIEKFGGSIAEKIGLGVQAFTAVLPGLMSGVSALAPIFSTLGAGFAPILAQLPQLGTTIMGTVQQIATSAMPVISSIMSTIQTVLPAILPVIQSVVSSVGTAFAQAAPVISGLVQGIGSAVTTLAPVFGTIFDGISSKVGVVMDFIGSKMGFIQEVISSAAPLISDILTTAWGVISPIMDIAINVFQLIFNVVQKVFPGIQRIISSVWNFIKPVVEGIGKALSKVGEGIGWLAGKIGIGGGGGAAVGNNAEGTNHWRGGLTWVGERGPELVELPHGSRVLPNKESVRFANSAVQPKQVDSFSGNSFAAFPRRESSKPAWPGAGRAEQLGGGIGTGVPPAPVPSPMPLPFPFPLPPPPPSAGTTGSGNPPQVTLTIAKLADSIIVRENADIDRIGEAVSKRVLQAIVNLA